MHIKNEIIDDESKNDGVTIFSKEDGCYDEKMDEYLRMRKKKEDKRSDNKDIDINAIEKKADVKQEEEELRAWRRKIRIKRNKEDAKWRKYREDRAKFQKEWKEMTKDKKKEIRAGKEGKDKEWSEKKGERKKSMDKRNEDDEKWKNKRKEMKERMNIPITSLVAILVIIDNYTRKCLGLPVFVSGKNVTADDVIKALKSLLPPELMYIIKE